MSLYSQIIIFFIVKVEHTPFRVHKNKILFWLIFYQILKTTKENSKRRKDELCFHFVLIFTDFQMIVKIIEYFIGII